MEKLLSQIFSKIEKEPSEYQAYEDLYLICHDVIKTDIPLAVKYLRLLSDAIEKHIPNSGENMGKLFVLHKKELLLGAYHSFYCYLLYLEFDRDPEKKFFYPRRKVLGDVVDAMQELEDGKLDLLTVSMPPGTGKSTLGIFYLTWIMGRHPDGQNLASAHSGTLTRSFYDGALQIITDPEYLWGDVFKIEIASTNSKEETIDIGRKHRFSTLTCRAINASLTGATRCDQILYADDLCSGIEEAMSKERLDKLWMTYTNDLKSRKKMSAKEIHIATRWSVHDVIGRLEREYGGSDRARFIVLPALNEKGESNFNYDYGVGFDTEYFEDMRANLDDASFRALFMNEPIEREGILYHPDSVRRFFTLPDGDPDGIIAVCDTKDRGKDYCVMPVAYIYGADYYIYDVICDNGLPEVVDARLVDILMRNKVKMCRFESNSAGGRIADKVEEGIKARGGITHITKRFTTANKETKIILNSAFCKEHFLFKDESVIDKGSDYSKFLNFLFSYTVAGKNTHDDCPDAVAMLAEYAQSLSGGKIEAFKRPW